MLRCDGLCKSFNARAVLRDIRLELDVGAYALQGANGVGKSTLLALLAGAETADAGDIWIDGMHLDREPVQARRRLSYAPDESPIYPFVTGRELLELVASLKAVEVGSAESTLAARLGLDSCFDTRFSELSLGAQKKFLLCAAWIGEPSVVLLDEPSNGLDIAARGVIAELFRASQASKTILFASHDAEFIAAAGASIITMDEIFERSSRPAQRR
jgi:ABC-2 type transport system ATP-binding protein